MFKNLFNRDKKKTEIIKEIPAEEKKQSGALKVEQIALKTGSLTEGLGITKERAEVLARKIYEAYHSSGDLVEAISKASEECVHQNELFFQSFMLSDIHTKHMQMQSMMGMMGKMFSDGKPDNNKDGE